MKTAGHSRGGNDGGWKAQARGFPPTLEIAARFPHSHRPATAVYFSENLSPKGAFLAACTLLVQAHSSIRKE